MLALTTDEVPGSSMGAMSGVGDGQPSTFINPFLSTGGKGSENAASGRGNRRPSSGGNTRHDPQVEKQR